jgi:spheroidene monooxygenase
MLKPPQAAPASSGAAAAFPLLREAGNDLGSVVQASRSGMALSRGQDAQGIQGPVAALVLANVARSSRLWGWSRIVRGSRPLSREPGLRWARVMGSGYGGGFSLRPSVSHQGVLALFDGLASAQAFLQQSAQVAAYRARSQECCVALLQPWSVRGLWGGQGIDIQAARQAPAGPVVALTRASIRPLKAVQFWAMAPAAQASLLTAEGCRLAAGLGEAPLLRQCTVSVWDSVAAMDAYARSGAHLAAIKAAGVHGFFSESMFVRFRLLAIEGRWQGRQHAHET